MLKTEYKFHNDHSQTSFNTHHFTNDGKQIKESKGMMRAMWIYITGT